MNPRIKHIAFGSSQEAMPTVSAEKLSIPLASSETTLRDEAALLLSISEICSNEVKTTGLSMLWSDAADDDKALFPKFPSLAITSVVQTEDAALLKPRSEGPRETARKYPLRPRLISMDASQRNVLPYVEDGDDESEDSEEISVSSPHRMSPISAANNQGPPIVTPTATLSIRRLPTARKQSHRLLKQAKREQREQTDEHRVRPPVSGKDKKGKSLQGVPPKGVPMKTIGRKKFSWKCYPE